MPCARVTVILCLLFSLECRSAAVAPPPQRRDLTAAIDRILEEQRNREHLPGLALAIVENDRVIYLRTLGLRNVERRLPVTPDTVFPIGSCTKAFTSMAVALAADHRLLSLDDHPRKLLPYFKMSDPEADANVTLRDMLSHRTGLKAYADLAAEPGVLSREEYVRAATAAKPTARFRTAFQYSNAMYSAIGEILAHVYGTTWERVIEHEVFAPLKMQSSTTSTLGIAPISDHVTGYEYDAASRSYRAVPPPRSLDALAPAGNIASTAKDMTQWLRMLTNRGRIDDRQFVSEAMLEEVTKPMIAINRTMSYALGWATYEWRGLRVVEHNGGSKGISALVSFIPARHVGFVFLANTSPNFMTKIGNAGKLFYPLLLSDAPEVATASSAGPTDGSPSPPTATPGSTTVPTIDDLLSRMIDAAGGQRNLRRHTSVEIHAVKAYENQGVMADYTIQQEERSRRNEVEQWTAAGKPIAQVRVFFDGIRGGQETTFGQDSTNDHDENARALREDAMHPLLHVKDLYTKVAVIGATAAGDEPAWIVELTATIGPPTRLYVSQKTGRILKQERANETAIFSNFTDVDGELVPYHITMNDALGEIAIDVTSMRFNVPIPDSAFRPQKPPTP